MTALNTDLVRQTAPNFATTLANSMLISDTSLTLQSGTGLPTATAITLTIDATDPVSGDPTPTLKEVVTGTLSGTTLSNLLRGQDGTTAQGHASGANVVMWWNANMINDFETSYLTQHAQLGTHTAITATSINNSGNETVGGNLNVTGTTTLTGTTTITALSNPYKFSVYRNAAWTDGSGAFALVTFDTKNFDTGSNYSVSTGQFVAPVAGFYWLSATANSTNSAGQYNITSLYKNGAEFRRGNQNISSAGTPLYGSSVTDLLQLAANDYIQVYHFGAGGVGTTGPAQTYFSGFLQSVT